MAAKVEAFIYATIIGLGVKTVVNQLKPLYIEVLPDINTNM